MSVSSRKLMGTTASDAGGLNVESLFSTYLYTGTGTTLNIVNGIDLAGEGGLVWHKYRGGVSDHGLFDTERGVSRKLSSNNTDAQAFVSGHGVTAFNSDGYTLGTQFSGENGSGNQVASWTFRKAPKFFDVVTYTGTGSAQNISHNLGSVPGVVIVKDISGSGDSWTVYHRSAGNTGGLLLNDTNAFITSTTFFNDTTPTDSQFTVGNATNTNRSGRSFVAYLFAHNDGDGEFGPTGDQDIIKCGSYTGAGATDVDVDLGFEPQWVLIKKSSASGDQWLMLDNMRGTVTGGNDNRLFANLSNNEAANDYLEFTSTGFKITGTSGDVATSGETYIYIAIRRGPMAVPESATDVFAVDAFQNPSTSPAFQSGFPVDLALIRSVLSTTSGMHVKDRLRGTPNLQTYSTAAELSFFSSPDFDYMDGWYDAGTNTNYYSWMWRRAPNFFDVVAYTGDGVAGRTVSHNLGVAPEMMWVKRRDSTSSWFVYYKHDATTYRKMYLEQTASYSNLSSGDFNSTLPTDSVITLGSTGVNRSGYDYIAYLFASLAGVSKVFSVTKSSGSDASVNCGFSAGPRFLLLKRTDSTGDWYVWDSERGIVAGNDPYLLLNSTAAEVTSTDYIDPTSNGFTIVNGGLADGDYIGYAVA